MITGTIKNKIDKIWKDIWASGLTQPITVIEQITYLMFIRSLDQKDIDAEAMENLTGQKQNKIFPETPEGQRMRWSKFKDRDAVEIFDIIQNEVFPFIKEMTGDDETAFSKYMKDASLGFTNPGILSKTINSLDLFTCLSDLDLTEICKHIAPLVSEKGEDDDALVFDNLVYGIMLNQIRKGKGLKRYQSIIQKRGNILLEKKMTIPAVKNKADELKKIVQDEYWDKASLMELESMRKSIRDLMKFAKSEGEAIHYTEFEDTWTERTEGEEFDISEDFEDYEKKVNSYLTTHADTLPIYKLRHNQPLTAGDYEMLSKIFTEELGTQEDYDRTFQDTPLGKLVRRIVKMDHDATMQLFSEYIDEHRWNSQQIAFVRNLIAYVEEHGYIDDMSILLKPPFDRPMPFVRLYSAEDLL